MLVHIRDLVMFLVSWIVLCKVLGRVVLDLGGLDHVLLGVLFVVGVRGSKKLGRVFLGGVVRDV